MIVWDNWIAMAFFATGAWALSCVLDVCMVGGGVYRRPSDGPLVAGLFCIVPVMAVGDIGILLRVDAAVAAVAMLSGIFYLLHVHFYFKALFALNDASNAEIFNTLSVLIVPILAFVMLGERLEPAHYGAIALAVVGVILLVRLQIFRLTRRATAYLGVSVLFVSLVMVLQAWVLQHVDYVTAIWLFSVAAFFGALGPLIVRPRRRRHIACLCRRFGVMFAGIQVLELCAVLGSQRATDVGPSVSLVALVECALPIFVILFSWALAVLSRRWQFTDSTRIQSALALQSVALPSKIVSMALIVSAILLIRQ